MCLGSSVLGQAMVPHHQRVVRPAGAVPAVVEVGRGSPGRVWGPNRLTTIAHVRKSVLEIDRGKPFPGASGFGLQRWVPTPGQATKGKQINTHPK